MSRWIDADALIANIQERYCKPCKERKEDYNEVRCRVCWVDDAMDEIDGFADNSIDICFCKECKYTDFCEKKIHRHGIAFDIDFCSYGEERSE